MRATAPYSAGYRGQALLAAAALDSTITHPDPRCVAACVWYSATLEAACEKGDSSRMAEAMTAGLRALRSADVETWLAPTAERPPHSWTAFASRWPEAKLEVGLAVEKALTGDYIDCLLTPWEEWPTGYVMSTLPQAAWAALQGDRADEGIRLAVMHGGRDADTIGAIAGGLVGARFGQRALQDWNPTLVRALRLGHQWPGLQTAGPFIELLAYYNRQ